MIHRFESGFLGLLLCLFLSGCGESQPARPARATGTTAPADSSKVRMGRFADAGDRPESVIALDSIPILKYVLQSSPNYTVDRRVVVDGYYYRFKVKAKDGTIYEAVSVRKLIKLCHELNVIARFREEDKGGHVMTGLTSSAKGIGTGAKNLVVHPGQSVKRVGQGTGRFLRATGGFFASPFREKKPVFASDGTDRALLGKGPAGGERRGLAYELGLDVYTDTPAAQELLSEVARKRLAGRLPLSASVFALPGGAVFTLSLTPMGYDPTTEEMIRDNSPDELKRKLLLRYLDLLQLKTSKEENPAEALVDNPNYSPREQAYLCRYLTDLRAVGNTRAALDFLAKQYSLERASIVSAQLELLALLHTRARRLKHFVPIRNTLGALGEDGVLRLIISIDTVRFWTDVKKSLELSINGARRSGARSVEIWSTGDIDRRSVLFAKSMNVKVYQNILRNPIFRKPREGVRQRERPKPKAPPVAATRSSAPRVEAVAAPEMPGNDLPGVKPTAAQAKAEQEKKKSKLRTYW